MVARRPYASAPMIGGVTGASLARRHGATPAAASAALTPSGRAARPARLGALRLRQHDLLFAVVSGAIGLWLVDDARFGERDGNLVVQRRDRRRASG